MADLNDEAARLSALTECNILDTAPEPVFDALAQLAAYICITPMVQIAFIDERRCWIKSSFGWNATEQPRELAICSYAIKEPDGCLDMRDLQKDDRFAANPLVTHDPYLRFYEGISLVTPEGHAVGVLSVMDRVPRTLRPEQNEALRALARQVVALLELRRHTAQLQSSEILLRGLFEASPYAILVVNGAGQIVRVNEGTEKLFGYSRDELLKQPVEVLVPDAIRERHHHFRNSYFTNPHTRPMGAGLLLHGRHQDGHEFPVDVMLSPLDTPKGRLVIAVARDDTERRRMEDELRQTRKRAEDAHRSKNDFFSRMSKELSAPLDAVLGYHQLLEEKTRKLGRDDMSQDLQNLQIAIKHLDALINEMSAVARTEETR